MAAHPGFPAFEKIVYIEAIIKTMMAAYTTIIVSILIGISFSYSFGFSEYAPFFQVGSGLHFLF